MLLRIFPTIILFLFLGGCRSGSPPVTVGPSFPIPLAIWRIQAFGDSLANPGSNTGCRMPDTDIAICTIALVARARALGPRVALTWDGTIGQIFSPWIGSRPSPVAAVSVAFTDYYQNTGDGYNPDAINIYFVGDHQSTLSPYPTTTATAGATADPRIAANQGVLPYIYINDYGFNSPFGYAPNQSVFVMLSDQVVQHELCHYLARFTSQCFGIQSPANPNRCYSTGEHVPSGAWNLMRVATPAPLVLPGSPLSNDPRSEKFEIDQRVFNGLWNVP